MTIKLVGFGDRFLNIVDDTIHIFFNSFLKHDTFSTRQELKLLLQYLSADVNTTKKNLKVPIKLGLGFSLNTLFSLEKR